jgi:hypothetical protein
VWPKPRCPTRIVPTLLVTMATAQAVTGTRSVCGIATKCGWRLDASPIGARKGTTSLGSFNAAAHHCRGRADTGDSRRRGEAAGERGRVPRSSPRLESLKLAFNSAKFLESIFEGPGRNPPQPSWSAEQVKEIVAAGFATLTAMEKMRIEADDRRLNATIAADDRRHNGTLIFQSKSLDIQSKSLDHQILANIISSLALVMASLVIAGALFLTQKVSQDFAKEVGLKVISLGDTCVRYVQGGTAGVLAFVAIKLVWWIYRGGKGTGA